MKANLAIAPRRKEHKWDLPGCSWEKPRPIYTAKVGPSAEILPGILELFVPKGALIADVTYGRGYFWKHISNDDYRLVASDASDRIKPKTVEMFNFFPRLRADMTRLPYRDKSLDAIVIDPPYGEMGGSRRKESFGLTDSYNLKDQIKNPNDLLKLYASALLEARRVLKTKGIAILKCQDAVNGGIQHWFHIEIYSQAKIIGFWPEDLFVPVQKQKPIMRHATQDHARKNHSFFWVFRRLPDGCSLEEIETDFENRFGGRPK